MLGAPQAPALVVRLVGSDASLDAAVAQVRALLDRLRHGALRDEDRARAAAALGRARAWPRRSTRAPGSSISGAASPALAARDPAPSLDDLRAFAAATLRDEAFVIVAARPPRIERDDPTKRPPAARDPNVKNRG